MERTEGKGLRFWRIERGLSQIELGLASRVGRWAIQLIETNVREATDDELHALSRALGVDPKELSFCGKNSEKPRGN
jgi:transcriptional regulator with XRE-family HTH domain